MSDIEPTRSEPAQSTAEARGARERALRSGRCPYDGGAHEPVHGRCGLCLEHLDDLARRSIDGTLVLAVTRD